MLQAGSYNQTVKDKEINKNFLNEKSYENFT